MKLFLSPHNDDETLFGAFTIVRERPLVCVVFDSFVQPQRGISNCTWHTRRLETLDAISVLIDTYGEVKFLGLSDAVDHQAKLLSKILLAEFPDATEIWAPAWRQDGHSQHNVVADAVNLAFNEKAIANEVKITWYATYTRTIGKSRTDVEVLPRSGDDIARKLRALTCYTSQLKIDPRLGCWPHFMNDLREYYVD